MPESLLQDGLVVFSKRACPTCVLIAGEMRRAARELPGALRDSWLRALGLRMESQDRDCRSHDVPLAPTQPIDVRAGGQAEVRRLDWAGGLCGAPQGRPGCAL